MISKLLKKTQSADESSSLSRKDTLVKQIDFILDTLDHSEFDILYMENLKNPLTPEEKVYFIQQIDRIHSAKSILMWLRTNIISNTPFWKRFLRW